MATRKYFGFSKNVFILSLVSFLNDIGGETIKRIIPLFLTNILGVGAAIVGLVEGVAEAAPQLLQPLAGWISDKQNKRKKFVVIGQILRSLMVLIAFATQWWHVLILRFIDRSGKGIQDAPRDALLSLSSDSRKQGMVFGLNRAFDFAGAVVGLAGAGIIVFALGNGSNLLSRDIFVLVVLLAGIPLALALLLAGNTVSDIKNGSSHGRHHKKDGFKNINVDLKAMPRRFWMFLAISFIFSLGNSSDAFVLLRGQSVGIPLYKLFLLFAGFSLVTALTAFPLGKYSDEHSKRKMLAVGWIIYSFVYLGLSNINGIVGYTSLLMLYGVYYGFTMGIGKALVSDCLDNSVKGVGFGLYNLVVGVMLLPASIIAGLLWEAVSPAAPFYFGAATSIIAALGLLVVL